ncbi:MAG: hypothetical protein H6581_13310 [Bacteroidia bacterium]|nr:hypothetical protein [Bacteroidia bacterium]
MGIKLKKGREISSPNLLFNQISIFLSLICILIAWYFAWMMAVEFGTVDGKTRAFFSFRHLERLYFGLFGVGGLMTAVIAIFRRESWKVSLVSIFFALLALGATLADMYRWMVLAWY